VPRPLPDPSRFRELVARQEGVISRAQAIAAGWTDGQVTRHLVSGRWRRLHHGVLVTHTGPVPWRAVVWAALLHAGPDAVASHRTAARLQGLLDEEPADVELLVPWGHGVRVRPGLVIRSTKALDERRHPSRSMPQTRVEHTVLDLAQVTSRPDEVVSWVLTACQRRATTPERLATALQTRPRHRHRRLILDVLSEAKEGIASTLERHYHTDVELPHGLPRARRGERITVAGRHWYADARYARFRLRIELEGLGWHPVDLRWRDDVRDNVAVLSGDVVLRFGWRAVVGSPCETAAQVAAVLRDRGWQGTPRRCSLACPVGRPSS
jgi:hypothetical protein